MSVIHATGLTLQFGKHLGESHPGLGSDSSEATNVVIVTCTEGSKEKLDLRTHQLIIVCIVEVLRGSTLICTATVLERIRSVFYVNLFFL